MKGLTWCSHCKKNVRKEHNGNECVVCCGECGRILYEDMLVEGVSFVKGPSGESRLAGTIIRSIESGISESYRRTLEKGDMHIKDLTFQLGITDGSVHTVAAKFYQIAVERSFTRGRRTILVAAACLYVACWSMRKPFLLIEFSICLSINVYVLGAVYLQLCKMLSLSEHSDFQTPKDPSLFLDRFTSVLMKDYIKRDHIRVTNTASHILASMKREWLQTGRKPSGLCGAAVYISSLSHGFRFSKSDIVKVVHICEATLTKRLIEFETTESGSLTVEEINKAADEFKKENLNVNSQDCGTGELLCEHRDRDNFAHRLCRSCYEEFIELSGGLHGGSEPPAFQLAQKRVAEASFGMNYNEDNVNELHNGLVDEVATEKDIEGLTELTSASASSEKLDMKDSDANKYQNYKDGPTNSDETGNLSDIDDDEVNVYLNNEEETKYKKIIWEEMNKEYLQEQAAKEAAAMAASSCYDEASDEFNAARKLATAATAAVAKSREERRRKRALEAKNTSSPQTAKEATVQMLTKKGLSSKINYDALEKLFDDDEFEGKRKCVGSQSEKGIGAHQFDVEECEIYNIIK